jgi:photosystem II stability/assembly factor-like uncharacterized protein
MEKLISYLMIVISVASCSLEEGPVGPSVELSAPEGFKITYVGAINFDGYLEQFQMVDENIGYVVGTTQTGRVDAYKTEDGGRSWKNLDVTNAHDYNMWGSAESICFLDTRIGVASYKIGDKVNIIRTTTGGSNWRGYVFLEFGGAIKHIEADEEDNLYAHVIDNYFSAMLIKSYDKGLSWDSLYVSQDLHFRYGTFDFKVHNGKIYVPGANGEIVVLDKEGQRVKTITTLLPGVWDLAILNEDHLIATGTNEVIRSVDGGQNWQYIKSVPAKMIGYNTAEEIFMVQKNEYISNNGGDVFAATLDGGATWLESNEAYNDLRFDLVNSQKIGDTRYLMLIGKEIYELSE